MKVLVTGATGFVGSHLVDRLLARHSPADITCLVQRSTDAKERANTARLERAGIRLIEGDLNRADVSPEPAPHADVVFHLAANIDTAASPVALRVNDEGTRHLLRWLDSAARGGRVVYTSSIAVLDRDGPADGPLNESSPCVPRTEYGRSKLRGEHVIQEQAPSLGYTYTILRLATVYGPGAKTDGLFDRLFKLTAKHSIVARLNWPGRTSIVHVEDLTAIMLGLSEKKEAENQIFCIANPEAPTVGALADQIAHLAPDPVDQIQVPGWLWALGRSMAWSRTAQLLGAVIAQTTFWRLTLMLDDGFWFDTQKLQAIWTEPVKNVAEALAEMSKYL